MRTSKESVGLLTGSIRGLSAAARNLGVMMTAGAAISGAAMFTLARRAESVNSAFREVESISSDVHGVQEEYGDLISDLNTEFGLQINRLGAIEALYQSVSAGVKEGEESQREFLETAADLAVVGRVDLATAVDVVSTSINAYGEDTEFAQEASEALFQTVQFGKVTLEELAPVMGRITALGSELGVNIQELGASMAVLTRTGFEARVAATGVRAILRSLMRPSEQMQDLLRQIAMEQDGLVQSLTEGHEELDGMAERYREATDAIRDLSQAQKAARREQDEASLAIQEARLRIQAIEQDRRLELENLTSEQVKNARSVEELEEIIEDYQFSVNKARVEEESSRLEKEELEEETQNLIDEFNAQLDVAGDLEGGIGQLITQEQGLVETLVDLRHRADEQNIAFDELFPRTRALQGALALVGEDGQLLIDIFERMQSSEEEAMELLEEHRDELDMTDEEAKELMDDLEEMNEADLHEWAEDMRGEEQQMRDAMGELSEAAEDLGQVFNEDVTDAITDIADTVSDFNDTIDDMSDTVRSNIGQLFVLGTILGLVLGPLLLIGGQMAIIASTMGAAFIPAALIAGTAFAFLASQIKDVLGAPEQLSEEQAEMARKFGASEDEITTENPVEEKFDSIRNAIGFVIDFIRDLRQAFAEDVLPHLINLSHTFYSIITSVAEGISEILDDGDIDPIRDMSEEIGSLVSKLNEWAEANEEQIVENLVSFADLLINRVIPNLIDFGQGVVGVIKNMDPKPFIAMAGMVGFLVLKFTDFLGVVGRWMSRNEETLGTFATLAAVVGIAGLALVRIYTAVVKVISVLAPLYASLKSAISLLGFLYNSASPVLNVVRMLGVHFPILTKVLWKFIKAGKAAVVGIKLIAGAFVSLGVLGSAAVLGVVALISGLVASVWIARDQIVAGWRDAWGTVAELIADFKSFLDGEINFRELGRSYMETLANGIRDGIGHIKAAMDEVAQTVSDYLPSSPANTGPLSKKPPGESGRNISSSVASGIGDGMPEVNEAFSDLEPDEFDVDTEIDMSGSRDQSSIAEPAMSGTKIEIGEKAIFFESGAFQGVSDEDMPEKVREEVEGVFEEEIIEKIEGRGQVEPPR